MWPLGSFQYLLWFPCISRVLESPQAASLQAASWAGSEETREDHQFGDALVFSVRRELFHSTRGLASQLQSALEVESTGEIRKPWRGPRAVCDRFCPRAGARSARQAKHSESSPFPLHRETKL